MSFYFLFFCSWMFCVYNMMFKPDPIFILFLKSWLGDDLNHIFLVGILLKKTTYTCTKDKANYSMVIYRYYLLHYFVTTLYL